MRVTFHVDAEHLAWQTTLPRVGTIGALRLHPPPARRIRLPIVERTVRTEWTRDRIEDRPPPFEVS